MPSSLEAEIIQHIQVLVRKLAVGDASPADHQLLQDLQKARVDLMFPRALRQSAGKS